MASIGIIEAESFACGSSSRLVSVTYKYQEGSLVYILSKARKGKLERVAVKRVQFISNKSTFNQIIINYVDTFNRVWFEYELCSEAEAVAESIAYLEKEQAAILAAIESCDI